MVVGRRKPSPALGERGGIGRDGGKGKKVVVDVVEREEARSTKSRKVFPGFASDETFSRSYPS